MEDSLMTRRLVAVEARGNKRQCARWLDHSRRCLVVSVDAGGHDTNPAKDIQHKGTRDSNGRSLARAWNAHCDVEGRFRYFTADETSSHPTCSFCLYYTYFGLWDNKHVRTKLDSCSIERKIKSKLVRDTGIHVSIWFMLCCTPNYFRFNLSEANISNYHTENVVMLYDYVNFSEHKY